MIPNHAAPADQAQHLLDVITRAEKAEAALDIAKGDLLHARQVNTALKRTLEKVRLFHETWGVTEDADQLALWEELGAVLTDTAPANEAVSL